MRKSNIFFCVLASALILPTTWTQSKPQTSPNPDIKRPQTGNIGEEADPSKIPQEPPQISVTVNGISVLYICKKNQWNGVAIKRMDVFDPRASRINFANPPTLKAGDTVKIIFDQYVPKALLSSQALILRTPEADSKVWVGPLNIEAASGMSKGNQGQTPKGEYSVLITDFSSNASLNTHGGTYLQGYSFTAIWGKNICEYSFVVLLSRNPH